MDKLLFGISGLPLADGKKLTYAGAIEYLHDIRLDAMELEFVRSIGVTDKNKQAILDAKNKYGIYLSAHGSYFINLNADEEEKLDKSQERILKGADALALVGGRSLVFHPAFYLKNTPAEAFENVKTQLLKLPNQNVNYMLETTGKGTQFGTYQELVALCKEITTCRLCIDFAHIHARYNGILKTYDDFAKILEYVKNELGQSALDDLHMHVSGIEYSEKGEKKHLPLAQSDFNYTAFLKVLKDYNVKGCLVCESPILEKDAILLKETYNKL